MKEAVCDRENFSVLRILFRHGSHTFRECLLGSCIRRSVDFTLHAAQFFEIAAADLAVQGVAKHWLRP